MNNRIQAIVRLDPFDDQTIIITPLKASFEDDSVYDIKLKNIKSTDGTFSEPLSISYVTQPKPYYIEYKDVIALAAGLELPEELVYHHIKEASKYADFIARKANKENANDFMATEIVLDKETIQTENYEYYMFIKYKAVRECVLSMYIEMSTNPNKLRNQTSDLVFEESFDLANLKKLLDALNKEVEDWEKELISKSANPRQTRLGKYACHSYHPIGFSGYRRDL